MAISMTAAGAESGVTLEVVEGDGAIHNVRGKNAATPRVRVSGADGLPVPGASVTFRLPESGPGALFAGGRIAPVVTDAKGEAAAPAMKLNSQLGPWEIRVAASHRGVVSRAAIQQINAAPVDAIAASGKKSRSLYWVAALTASAALAASVGFMSGGGGSVSRSGGVNAPTGAAAGLPPVTISAGAGSAGAP